MTDHERIQNLVTALQHTIAMLEEKKLTWREKQELGQLREYLRYEQARLNKKGKDRMRILVACESSGVVRRAFRALGHDAWSCDLLPADDTSPFHIQADVLSVLNNGWDMMIAFPTCTYLCNSGAHWLHRQEGRWEKMRQGAEFFKSLLNAPIHRIAIENPVMHKYAKEIIGMSQSQSIQPYEFGHPESKRTCLWLKNLPLLKPTNVLEKPASGHWDNQTASGQNKLAPSADRWKLRSKTYEGIGAAMAEQWGKRSEPLQMALF